MNKTKATANRYRDLLSGMFKRAIRDGHLAVNPVKSVSKFLENNEREMIIYRPRFPRIATDQTAVLPVASLDPVRLMIEHLRSFRDASMMAGRSASEPV